jgi:integrase
MDSPETVASRRKASPASYELLSQALARAEALGYIGKNPADARLVNRPIGPKPSFTVIDAKPGEKVLAAIVGSDPRDVAAHLALGLGLRREELLAPRWEDFEDDVVHVRRTLTWAGAVARRGPKSEGGERDLPLPAFVARSLRRHRASQAERLLAIGVAPSLVVDDGWGSSWQPASLSTGWRRWARVHGFEGVTFHTLRRGAATLMLAAGVSDAVAVQAMGVTPIRRFCGGIRRLLPISRTTPRPGWRGCSAECDPKCDPRDLAIGMVVRFRTSDR